MSDNSTAKLYEQDEGQIVQLPEIFRMPGTEVRITRVGRGVMLEPIVERPTPEQIRAMFAAIDAISDEPFLPEGREQPPMPPDDDIDSFDT